MPFNIAEFIFYLEQSSQHFEDLKSGVRLHFSADKLNHFMIDNRNQNKTISDPEGSYYVEYRHVIVRNAFREQRRINDLWIEMTDESGGLIQEML